jgi:hypothetical protein
MNRVTLSFTEPGVRRKGFIEVEVNPTNFNYEALGELHNQVLDHVRKRENGFNKLRRSHGEAYVREIKNTDTDKAFLAEFINTVYGLPAAASFINSNNKPIVDNYVNKMIEDIERMTMGGKRRTKRRNKKSKKSRKNKRRSRRH